MDQLDAVLLVDPYLEFKFMDQHRTEINKNHYIECDSHHTIVYKLYYYYYSLPSNCSSSRLLIGRIDREITLFSIESK